MNMHALSVDLEKIGDHSLLTMRVLGKLTHEDYQTITPMVDSAVADSENSEIDVLIDASQMDGWELRAAWDDLKLGLKHRRAFHRVAIHGNKKWQQQIAKMGSWFVSGEVHYFDSYNDALQWVKH